MTRKARKLLIYSFIPLIPLVIIFLNQTVFRSLKIQMVESTSLPLRILLFPVNEMKKLITYHSTYNEYVTLREEVENLKSRLIGQEEMIRENQRYKQLLDFKHSLVYSTVAANVIGRDPDNWSSSMIIDRGRVHGLETGMPVVSPLGVVGKIAEVGSSVSKVILLVDPNFSVAAVVQRTREAGVVSGTLEPVCRMRYLDGTSNIRPGDKVISSKMSLSFPEGLLIGHVYEVYESQSSPTLECLVEPVVNLSQVEEVLVILK